MSSIDSGRGRRGPSANYYLYMVSYRSWNSQCMCVVWSGEVKPSRSYRQPSLSLAAFNFHIRPFFLQRVKRIRKLIVMQIIFMGKKKTYQALPQWSRTTRRDDWGRLLSEWSAWVPSRAKYGLIIASEIAQGIKPVAYIMDGLCPIGVSSAELTNPISSFLISLYIYLLARLVCVVNSYFCISVLFSRFCCILHRSCLASLNVLSWEILPFGLSPEPDESRFM